MCSLTGAHLNNFKLQSGLVAAGITNETEFSQTIQTINKSAQNALFSLLYVQQATPGKSQPKG